MKCHYQIEYYNKLWKDWIAFDQVFYKTQKQAQARIDDYKEGVPEIETRIIQTTILYDKPKRYRQKKSKITTEKIK